MADNKTKANRPDPGGQTEGNTSGPRVRYQLPPEEASPPTSPDGAAPPDGKQAWTIKKFDIYGDMPEYNNKLFMYLGFVQIGLGVASFILGIVLIAISAHGSASGIGIWAGLIFIAAGVVAVVAFRNPRTALVIACFGLSAASVLIAFIMFIMLCYFTNLDDRRRIDLSSNIEFFKSDPSMNKDLYPQLDAAKGKLAVGVLIIFVTLAELVSALLEAVFVGKIFLVRGVQRVPTNATTIRYSASNPLPAAEPGSGAADQSWGEYNPPARDKAPGDQSWGEYKPPPSYNTATGGQSWGEYEPQPKHQSQGAGAPELEPSEWKEYKPQKGRKAMREASMKGSAPKAQVPRANAGSHLAHNQSEVPVREPSPQLGGGIIRKKATGTVDVEEEHYPTRHSQLEDDDDYDIPPAPISASFEI